GYGAAVRIHARGPSLIDEGSGEQVLARGAVEDKEKGIAAGLREKFPRLAFELSIEQNGSFDRVPVVDVVRRRLKGPDKFARVRIERNDGASVEIVAGPIGACQHRIGIAGAPIKKIEVGIVSSGHPGHAAAVEDGVAVSWPSLRARLAGIGLGVPAPLDGSGFGIE